MQDWNFEVTETNKKDEKKVIEDNSICTNIGQMLFQREKKSLGCENSFSMNLTNFFPMKLRISMSERENAAVVVFCERSRELVSLGLKYPCTLSWNKYCATRGLHSTEVVFALLTQQPRVRFPFFPKVF